MTGSGVLLHSVRQNRRLKPVGTIVGVAAMSDHWTLETIKWSSFDRAKLDPHTLMAVKAASLVEKNALDYVAYLRVVFKDDPDTLRAIERWGWEEVQHGDALGRWSEVADPSFNFKEAYARFRAGYTPPHFVNADGSVRGSRIGELIARCVVECGTSSGYTALRDSTDEPVLKQIAGARLLGASEDRGHPRERGRGRRALLRLLLRQRARR
jgi:hypothetical protein